jgi:hypothetical protein
VEIEKKVGYRKLRFSDVLKKFPTIGPERSERGPAAAGQLTGGNGKTAI